MTEGAMILFLCTDIIMHIVMETVIDNNKTLRSVCRSSTINEASQYMREQIREAINQGWLQIDSHP